MSTSYMPYTCGDVDEIFDSIEAEMHRMCEEEFQPDISDFLSRKREELKKKVTYPFRDALEKALEERQEEANRADIAEEKQAEAEEEVGEKENEIHTLEKTIERLEKQLAEQG